MPRREFSEVKSAAQLPLWKRGESASIPSRTRRFTSFPSFLIVSLVLVCVPRGADNAAGVSIQSEKNPIQAKGPQGPDGPASGQPSAPYGKRGVGSGPADPSGVEGQSARDAQQNGQPSTSDNRPRKRARGFLRALLHYGGSALALELLFRFLPGRPVLHALGKLPPLLWVAVVAAYLATHLIGVGKWRLMVNTAGAGLNYLQAARCYFAGLFGTLFLPSLIGGDLVRVTLAMRYGKTRAGVLLGSFLDRIIDFTALVLLAVAGALLVPGALEPQSRRAFLWIGAAAIAGLAMVTLVVTLIPFRRLSIRMRRRMVSLRRAGRSMMQRPRSALAALGMSVVSQLSFISLSIVLAEACGLRLVFRAWLFAWPIAKLSAAIPVTQGGLGVREAALAGLLAPFGAPPTLAVAAGLAWEAVSISGALISGAFALGVRRRA